MGVRTEASITDGHGDQIGRKTGEGLLWRIGGRLEGLFGENDAGG